MMGEWGSVRIKKSGGKDRRERFLSSLTPTSDELLDCRVGRLDRVLVKVSLSCSPLLRLFLKAVQSLTISLSFTSKTSSTTQTTLRLGG